MPACNLDQGVCAAHCTAALVNTNWLERVDRRAQRCATLRVQSGIQVEHAVEGLAEVQIAVVELVVGVCERAIGIDRVPQAASEVAEVLRVEFVRGFDKARLFFSNSVCTD